MVEEWRDIKDYEGLYQVSSHGRVRSTDRLVKRNNPRKKVHTMMQKSVILKEAFYSNGYAFVVLSKEGIVKQYMVHRMVASAFLPVDETRNEVNHKDGNKKNNNLSNLEWCTRHENMQHASGIGLININGANNPQAKSVTITKNSFIKSFPTIRAAAQYLNVKEGTLAACRRHNRLINGYKISDHANNNV